MKKMFKAIGEFFVPFKLEDSDMFNTLSRGVPEARALENDLEISTGIKPRVSSEWKNGQLMLVSVVFPRIDETRPSSWWATIVRDAVIRRFKRTPEDIVLGFSVRRPN